MVLSATRINSNDRKRNVTLKIAIYSIFRNFLLLGSALLIGLPMFGATRYPELSDARLSEIARMLPEKPAGFGVPCSDRAAWQQVAERNQANIEKADGFLAKPLPGWDDTAYLRYSRDGDRKDGETMLNQHSGQLGPLVLAECSEWKGRFLSRITEQLEAIAADKSWTLPAADPKLENFSGRRYYVDLRSAILAHDVAEAMYLLGDKVPETTRQQVRAAMELHVFAPMRGAFAGQPEAKTYISWLTAKHNWNAVCLEGVVDAALTLLEDKQDRAVFAAAAEHWGENYLDSFTGSGYDSEGIGYWEYGFSHYNEMREQLWLSTKGKLDLFDDAKARRAALFGFQFAMLPDVYADFGDAHFMMRPDARLLAQIDRTFGLKMYGDDLAVMRATRPEALSMALLESFPNDSQVKEGRESRQDLIGVRTWYPESGVLVDRPNPQGELAVTIKAGGNGNHSHNDIGSYSIGLGTSQIVGDPGGPSYYDASVFSSKRYDSRLLNSFGHPVPVVDGKLQKEATTVHPTVVSTLFTPDADVVAMDITSAYDAPKLRKLVRTMRYSRKDGTVEIADVFEVAEPIDIEESLPTHGTIRQVDAKTLEFSFEGRSLLARIEAPVEFTVTQEPVNDYGNPFLRVGARFHLTQSGTVTMRFRATGPAQLVNVNENTAAAGDAPEDAGPMASDVSRRMKPAEIRAAVKKVADWQYGRIKDAPSQDWTFAPLYDGFLAVADAFDEPRYRELVNSVGEHFHWTLGTGRLHTDANEEALGYSYLKLYEHDHEAQKIAGLRESLNYAREHNGSVDGEPKWWWCDALFMAPPTWTAAAKATGDNSLLEFTDTQYRTTDTLLWSKQYHLYFRDKNFLNRTEANGRPIFWSRGNGWVFAGLAMVLDSLPANDARRTFYLSRYREMASEVILIQGQDGLWRTGLLDAEAYPHPEVSGSAFFVYGLAWGLNHHVLERATYYAAVERGWEGLSKNIYADGRLGNIQPVGDSPGKYRPSASYVFGVGAFLLAGAEVNTLAQAR